MKMKKFLILMITLIMCLGTATAIAEEATGVAQVIGTEETRTFDDLQTALDFAETGDTIKILKDTEHGTSITKKLNIIVPSGVTFNVKYFDNNGVQVMEPNITVENGGTVKFSRYRMTAGFSYLVMNGDMVIESGANVLMRSGNGATGEYNSGVLFMGDFKNKGTLDCYNESNKHGVPYIKYGQEVGTVTNGFPIYNLCLTMPSDETINGNAVRVTAITGKAEYGETLTAEIDGFGNSANLPDGVKKRVQWSRIDPIYNIEGDWVKSDRYTVGKEDIGKIIGVNFMGIGGGDNYLTSVYPYCYILYKDNKVISIQNGYKTNLQTETIPQVDLTPQTVYLGGANANDENSGKSAQEAVKSFKTAVELVKDGGEVIVCGDVEIPSLYTSFQFNYITKSITFKAAENANPTFIGGSYSEVYGRADASFIILNKADIALSFKGIKFDYNVALGSIYEGTTFNFENVSTTDRAVLQPMISKDNYEEHNINIKNSKNFTVDPSYQNGTSHTVTIDNSSVINGYPPVGSMGNVKLLNGSTLKTEQPIQTLTADGTNNKLELVADTSGNISPITIEGDITVADKPIEILFEGNLSNGDKLITSSNGNTSITIDKFKITKSGVSLMQNGNDIVAKTEETEEFTIGYANGKAEIYVPTAGEYTVIFVDLEAGALNKMTAVPLSITADKVGTNEVTPEGITLGAGDKIMLWNSLEGMVPLTNAYVLK